MAHWSTDHGRTENQETNVITQSGAPCPSPPTVQMCHSPGSNRLPAQQHPSGRLELPRTRGGVEHQPADQPQNRCTALHSRARNLANCPSLREPRLLSVAGVDRTFCSEPSCGSARLGWLPSSASPSFVMGVREFAPAAGGTAPKIGRCCVLETGPDQRVRVPSG
jgi:hypothetical protein